MFHIRHIPPSPTLGTQLLPYHWRFFSHNVHALTHVRRFSGSKCVATHMKETVPHPGMHHSPAESHPCYWSRPHKLSYPHRTNFHGLGTGPRHRKTCYTKPARERIIPGIHHFMSKASENEVHKQGLEEYFKLILLLQKGCWVWVMSLLVSGWLAWLNLIYPDITSSFSLFKQSYLHVCSNSAKGVSNIANSKARGMAEQCKVVPCS